jgi:hypothetical protein
VTSLVATVVLARARRGMTNKIRLANAAIVPVEKQRKHQPLLSRRKSRCVRSTRWALQLRSTASHPYISSDRTGKALGFDSLWAVSTTDRAEQDPPLVVFQCWIGVEIVTRIHHYLRSSGRRMTLSAAINLVARVASGWKATCPSANTNGSPKELQR